MFNNNKKRHFHRKQKYLEKINKKIAAKNMEKRFSRFPNKQKGNILKYNINE